MTRCVSGFLLACGGLLLGCSGDIAGGEEEQPGASSPPAATPGGGSTAAPGAAPTTMGGAGGSGAVGTGATPAVPGTPPQISDKPLACGTPAVAEMPLRRLTRIEYANTVRDLLGITRPSTEALTPDEQVGPFTSNTVASATDLVAQQYMESAEALARSATTRVDALSGCNRMTAGDDACATQLIDRLGLRAYRRPLAGDEKARYRTVFTTHAASGGFANGARVVIQTLLQSPHFLYHMEIAEGPATTAAAGTVVPLGPYAVAARLSYFLWNTMPDDALFQAAASGALADPKGLRAQIDRMTKDGRARESITNFYLQWFDVDGVGSIAKDTKVFPKWSSALRTALRNETIGFADYVLRRGDGKLETLLAAPQTIVPDPMLFEHYGTAQPADYDPARPVPLDPQQRAGLFTQGSVLATHAHANQSSPVARGVVVRKNILCQDLPDPPPDVNNNPPEPRAGLTTRERFLEHQKNPACAPCHSLIDDIGFGFENFDGVGAWRTTESGKTIDPRGTVRATEDADGPFTGAVELARRLARSKTVQKCVAKQYFRFALGRREAEPDHCSLQKTLDAFAASGFDLRELVATLIASDAFRTRRVGER